MWSRKFAALLPEVDKRQLYRKRGFYSIFEFAAKLAGMGRKNVEEVLRTYKVDKKTALEFRKFQQQLEKEAKIKIPLGKVLSELLTKIEPAPKISSVLGKSKKVTRSHEDIVPLCKNHHRMAHAGLVKNEEQAPALWSIQTERNWNDYKSRVDVMVMRY